MGWADVEFETRDLGDPRLNKRAVRKGTSLLGVDVDLLTPGDLPPKFREKVLAEFRPV